MTPSANILVNPTTKKITVRDTTPQSAVLFPPADVIAKGIGAIYDADGVVVASKSSFANAFLTHVFDSTTDGVLFDAPLDDQGEVVQGAYQLVYGYAFQNSGLIPVSGGVVAGKYVIVGKDFTELLIAGATFVVSGFVTAGNNGSKTIVSSTVVAGNTVVTVSGSALTDEAAGAAVFAFAVTLPGLVTKDQSYLCEMITPSVNVEYDCDYGMCGRMLIKNTSDIGSQTLTSRLFTVTYPSLLNPEPETNPVSASNVDSVTLTKLAEGVFTYSLKLGMQYVGTDGLVVVYTAQLIDTVEVSCAGFLCSIRCCFEHILGLSESELGLYKKQTSEYSALINRLTALYVSADMARRCGKKDTMRVYLEKMKTLIDNSGYCSDDCGCGSTTGPRWIDNSGFEAQTLLENLYEDVAEMQQLINDVQQLVSTNASALEDYNAIQAAITGYNTNLTTILATVSQAQSLALALNPESPTFTANVAQLVTWMNLVDSQLDPINTELVDLQTDIAQFNIDYPDFQQYTISLLEYIDDSFALWISVNSAVGALITALGTLTPTSFGDDIEDIISDLQSLTNVVNDLSMTVALMEASQNNVWANINNIIGWIYDLNQQLTLLQNSVANMTGAVVPFQGAVNVADASAQIPGSYWTLGKFIKITAVGKANGVANQVKILNSNSATNVYLSADTADKDFRLELIIAPINSTTFKLGGSMMISAGGVQHIIQTPIGSPNLVYGADNPLKISGTDPTCVFSLIEVEAKNMDI